MSYTVREGSVHASDAVGSPVLGVGQDGVYKALPIGALEPDVLSPAEVHVPSAATAAVVTLPAPGANLANVLGGVAVSYSADPTGGKLTITDGGETVFDLDIPAKGVLVIPFSPPRKARPNRALVITLASGAGSVQGKLNLLGAWIEPTQMIGSTWFDDASESGTYTLFF